MRELIESHIRNSRWWKAVYDCGEDLPILNNMSDADLLELFEYTVTH